MLWARVHADAGVVGLSETFYEGAVHALQANAIGPGSMLIEMNGDGMLAVL